MVTQQIPPTVFPAMATVLRPLTAALNARDPRSAVHSTRVAAIASVLSEHLGLSESFRRWIWLGGLVHDVGKIGIPDSVLLNPGRLTSEEFATVKRHPVIGADILEAVDGVPQLILDIVSYHHERVDGKGYPEGRAGSEIPLPARIVAIADAWDAMTSDRVYRPALPLQEAREEMVRGTGSQFDPDLVKVFLSDVAPRI